MIALDNGDKIRGDASTATVVDYTLHGFVGNVATQLADGQLANSIGDLYTAGTAGIGVSSVILTNTDSSARTVNLYLTPSGGTARRLIPKDLSLGAGYSIYTDGTCARILTPTGATLTDFAAHASNHTNGTDDIQTASTTQKGLIAELATTAETTTGTDTTRAVTPDGLKDGYLGSANVTTLGTIGTGVWEGTAINQTYLVGQSGTNTGDEVAADLTTAGIVELATGAETNTGTDATRAVTPDGLDDWTGSAQLTTLGTVGTGVWEGTTVAVDQGGTGQTSYTDGQLLIGNTTGNTLAKATLTAGEGIDVTNGNGTITVLGEDASVTNKGIAELATDAETLTGTDTARTMTPSNASANFKYQGKETLWIPATAMTPTASNGCATLATTETTAGRPDMNTLDFDATADEHAQFTIAFPKSWDEGTVTYQAYWTTTATDTDGVAWGLQGVATSDSDTIDVAYGTAIVVTDDAISAAEDCYITAESSAITIAGTPAAEDMCHFRMFRDVSDANDDMTEDARLLGIRLFYSTDAKNDA